MFSTFLIIVGIILIVFGVIGVMIDADSGGIAFLWIVGLVICGVGILIKDISAANAARPVEKTIQPITIIMKCPHCGLNGMSSTNVVTKTQTIEKE